MNISHHPPIQMFSTLCTMQANHMLPGYHYFDENTNQFYRLSEGVDCEFVKKLMIAKLLIRTYKEKNSGKVRVKMHKEQADRLKTQKNTPNNKVSIAGQELECDSLNDEEYKKMAKEAIELLLMGNDGALKVEDKDSEKDSIDVDIALFLQLNDRKKENQSVVIRFNRGAQKRSPSICPYRQEQIKDEKTAKKRSEVKKEKRWKERLLAFIKKGIRMDRILKGEMKRHSIKGDLGLIKVK